MEGLTLLDTFADLILDTSINEFNLTIFGKLKTSLLRHGQLNPVHVYPESDGVHYRVVAGSRVVAALRDLGFKQTLCRVHATRQEALQVSLEVDLLHFTVDPFKLIDRIKELEGKPKQLQHSLPWSEQEIKNMISASEFDWERFGDKDEVQLQMF